MNGPFYTSDWHIHSVASYDAHLHVVVPLPKNMPEITAIIRQEIEYKGVSVIIPRRECVQTLQRHLKQKKAKEAQQ